MKLINGILFGMLLLSFPALSQIKEDFNDGTKGWISSGDISIVPSNTSDGDKCVKLGNRYSDFTKKVAASPLSIVNFKFQVRTSDTTIKAYSYISFLDGNNKELLRYKSKPVTSTIYKETGNYTEAPPGTKYIKVGVERDSSGKGFVYIDNFNLDTNVGEPKKKHPSLVHLDQYMHPFWKTDTIYNETVLLYAKAGDAAKGRLLFKPDKIIAIKNFNLQTLYKPGIDYSLNGNVITRKPNSGMSYRADTSFNRTKNLEWYDTSSQWIVVTYIHHDKWQGPVPQFKGNMVPGIMAKLKAKKTLNIVAYGMSITRGMNVSGYDTIPPYMPNYLTLFTKQLRKAYRYNNIQLYNAGLPGATVGWGAKYAKAYITPLKPDLVVIDFGMNDFWRTSPEQFKVDIQTIMKKSSEGNRHVEFLLISNMKFDPDYVLDSDKNKQYYLSNVIGYSKALSSLEKLGVINLDMTDISDVIYSNKKAKDCIANPLHPNDYMARWYAQGLAQLLIPNYK
jgi:lysophospholipase L1-like esterase